MIYLCGGSTRPFGDGELFKDGSLTALQVGADGRVGDWLLGGLRYEALPGQSRFVGEFSIGHRRGGGDGGFVMARFEARR